MALDDLLTAAQIFGGIMPQVDPRVRAALLAKAGLAPPVGPPMTTPPIVAPRVAPQAPQSSPFNPVSILQYIAERPQQPDEGNLDYMVARALSSPLRFGARAIGDVRQGIGELSETPRQREAKAKAAKQGTGGGGASAFPTSFRDPAYDSADAYAAKLTGVPVELISRVRLLGERSNAGQVSSAGANTPYQITPETRQGIIKNYGIDPWSSPQNAALGAAYVLREQAGAPRAWTPEAMTRAVGGYFGGAAGAANPFGGLSDGNMSVGSYVQRVLGPDTGLPAPFLNPYNPAFDMGALSAVGRERQALMTPFSASLDIGPPPEMPKPEALPTTDFSKSDAALEAMRPIEMSEKERLTRERDGFWKGISQAMMHSSGNEGLGTFLMRMGGAALGGRMQARDEIRDEQDKFEEKMARFNAAVFQNELNKANVHAHEAQAQVQQNNDYNLTNWKAAYQRWLGAGSIDVSGTNAVVTRKDPKTGQLSVNTIPIQGAVDAAIAQQTAQIFQSMGGRQMAGNQQITGMTNAIIGRAAIASMSGGATAESDGAAAAAPAFYGTFIATHGLTPDLLGPNAAKSLEESVQKQLMSMQLVPGSKEYIDRHDRLVAVELAKLGLADPKMMQKMMQVGGSASSFEQMGRYYGRSERTSTNAKGQTTSSTTYDGDASDIFGGM